MQPARLLIAGGLLALLGTSAFAQVRLPPGFVALRSVDPSIRQEMRYAGRDNFTGRPLPGYDRNECLLRREAALALKRVQADLTARGFSLKVYDCYRPTRAVAAMARWAADPNARPDTSRFYPGLNKRNLFALGYIASHSAHSRGVAVDLTIVPGGVSQTPPYNPAAHYGSCTGDARAPDDSVDMGTGFDCFSVKSRTRSAAVTPEQRKHRELLVQTMARHGFRNYAREWWHFSYRAANPGSGVRFSRQIACSRGEARRCLERPPRISLRLIRVTVVC